MSDEQPSDPDRVAPGTDKLRAGQEQAEIRAARLQDMIGSSQQAFRPLELPSVDLPYPFRRELAACIELLHFAKQKLHNTKLNFRDTTSEVVGIHYVRAANTYEAILHLALDGFGAQAELLIRPLFELALTAAWASRNPAVTEKRYNLHRRYAFSLWIAEREQSGIYNHVESQEILSPAEKKEAIRLFGAHAERSWTGKSLRVMARELRSQHDPNDGGLVHWEASLNIVLPYINWAMHSTGIGNLRAISHENRIAFLTSGPSRADIRDSLSVAWWVYALALETFISHFNLEFSNELRPVEFRVWASFKDPDLIHNLTDTDPCPCKSGVAFGQCHGRLR